MVQDVRIAPAAIRAQVRLEAHVLGKQQLVAETRLDQLLDVASRAPLSIAF